MVKPYYEYIPIFGALLRSNSRLDLYSPEEKRKLQAECREALGLGDQVEFSNEAFNKLTKASMKDYKSFAESKGVDGNPLFAKLDRPFEVSKKERDKNPDDIQRKEKEHQQHVAYVKSSIKAILAPTPEFTDAQTEYNESIATFKDLVQGVPTKYRAQDLIGAMTEIKDDAIKAIEAQHKHERDKLEELFSDDANLNESLRETLGITSNEGVTAVKDTMLKDLQAKQNAQLEEFKKSTAESVNLLHKASESQMKALLFIANLRKNNEEMREIIDDLAQKSKQAQTGPTAIEIGIKDNMMSLSGVKISDLPIIKGITGKKIKQQDGVFTVTYSHWSPSDYIYGQDPRQNHKTDLTLMANAIRATGCDIITFDIQLQPQDYALERAKEAYEAAINSGFPPHESQSDDKNKKQDHIIIIVNRKTYTEQELFSKDPKRLAIIREKAGTIQKELKELEEFKAKGPTDITAVKKDIQTQRALQKEKEAQQAQEPDQDEQASITAST